MFKLIIIRHCESVFNAQNKFTGLQESHLSEEWKLQASIVESKLPEWEIKHIYSSAQYRAIQTLVRATLHREDIELDKTIKTPALNERCYWDWEGKDKQEILKLVGQEDFNSIRRWLWAPPNWESLLQVRERALKYFQEVIFENFKKNPGNILVMTHWNTIRSILNYIENISDDNIININILPGQVLVYNIDFDKSNNIIKLVKE